jgi:hypothetical protein
VAAAYEVLGDPEGCVGDAVDHGWVGLCDHDDPKRLADDGFSLAEVTSNL